MGSSDEDPPLSEPVIQPDSFATGIDVEPIDGEVRLVAWVQMGEERRIVSRVVIPNNAGRKLSNDLRKVLARGGH